MEKLHKVKLISKFLLFIHLFFKLKLPWQDIKSNYFSNKDQKLIGIDKIITKKKLWRYNKLDRSEISTYDSYIDILAVLLDLNEKNNKKTLLFLEENIYKFYNIENENKIASLRENKFKKYLNVIKKVTDMSEMFNGCSLSFIG